MLSLFGGFASQVPRALLPDFIENDENGTPEIMSGGMRTQQNKDSLLANLGNLDRPSSKERRGKRERCLKHRARDHAGMKHKSVLASLSDNTSEPKVLRTGGIPVKGEVKDTLGSLFSLQQTSNKETKKVQFREEASMPKHESILMNIGTNTDSSAHGRSVAARKPHVVSTLETHATQSQIINISNKDSREMGILATFGMGDSMPSRFSKEHHGSPKRKLKRSRGESSDGELKKVAVLGKYDVSQKRTSSRDQEGTKLQRADTVLSNATVSGDRRSKHVRKHHKGSRVRAKPPMQSVLLVRCGKPLSPIEIISESPPRKKLAKGHSRRSSSNQTNNEVFKKSSPDRSLSFDSDFVETSIRKRTRLRTTEFSGERELNTNSPPTPERRSEMSEEVEIVDLTHSQTERVGSKDKAMYCSRDVTTKNEDKCEASTIEFGDASPKIQEISPQDPEYPKPSSSGPGCRVIEVEAFHPGGLGPFSQIEKISTQPRVEKLRRSARPRVTTQRLTVGWSPSVKERSSPVKNNVKRASPKTKPKLSLAEKPCVPNTKLTSSRSIREGQTVRRSTRLTKQTEHFVPGPPSNSNEHTISSSTSSNSTRATPSTEDANAKCPDAKPTETKMSVPARNSKSHTKRPEIENRNGFSRPKDPPEWTDKDIQQLVFAHREVNPISSTFWYDIAMEIEGKSAAECQAKWFSLVKTPRLRRKNKHKRVRMEESSVSGHHVAANNPEEPMLSQEDDIFNSTPLREGFVCRPLNFAVAAKQKNDSDKQSVDGWSPILMESNDEKDLETEYDETDSFLPLSVPMRVGYKTYLQGIKRGVAKANKEKKTFKNGSDSRQRSPCVLSETLGQDDVNLKASLTPRGTLRLNGASEADSDAMDCFLGSEAELSDCDYVY